MSSIVSLHTVKKTRIPGEPAPRLSLLAIVFRWIDVRRSRKALGELTDVQLDDIGLTSEQARREADMPFWQARLFR